MASNMEKQRTIQFRAWDQVLGLCRVESIAFPLGGHMGAVTVVNRDAEYYTLSFENAHLMQYTGLKDKNGKEIYEGDMFGRMGGDRERPDEYEIHAVVYFDNDMGAFCIDDQRGGWEYLGDYLLVSRNEREVIGNIYENPELLDTN